MFNRSLSHKTCRDCTQLVVSAHIMHKSTHIMHKSTQSPKINWLLYYINFWNLKNVCEHKTEHIIYYDFLFCILSISASTSALDWLCLPAPLLPPVCFLLLSRLLKNVASTVSLAWGGFTSPCRGQTKLSNIHQTHSNAGDSALNRAFLNSCNFSFVGPMLLNLLKA